MRQRITSTVAIWTGARKAFARRTRQLLTMNVLVSLDVHWPALQVKGSANFARTATVAGIACAASISALAQATSFPNKPIRVIVAASAGSGPDNLARIIGAQMSKQVGQPVVVEALPGASGIIATDKVAKSPADGYTLLFGVSQLSTINPHLYTKLPYDIRDIVPVSQVTNVYYLLLATNDLKASNISELVALARKEPGKITYASGGNGGSQHLMMEVFKKEAGVDMLHVPYRSGGLAHTDLMAGQVQVMIDPLSSASGLVKSGKVKALAVTSPERLPAFPNVPTVREVFPSYVMQGWNYFAAPRGTPPAVIAYLNKAINEAIREPGVAARIKETGIEPYASTSEELAARIDTEYAQWGAVVKQLNIKLD